MRNFTPDFGKRLMVHSNIECPLECQYCFAKREDYCNSCQYSSENDGIIYPFCDSEILFQNYHEQLLKIAEDVEEKGSRLIISISTKMDISDDTLSFLREISKRLEAFGGFLKLSVSITTKNSEQMEKGAASYSARIDLLKRIKKWNIRSAVVLKPILPFVPKSEYIHIINDTCSFTDKYLIGGLYVDKNSEFYSQYIEGKYPLESRCVEWLDGARWDYIESSRTQTAVKSYISSIGKCVFDSDKELVLSWL